MTAAPERIGRFQIRSRIGQGGMGTLYLAWDPDLERDVAIKVLSQDDEQLRARFLREARSAARLRHPHIITIFDVGSHEGQPFIAMEYIPGFTLAAVVSDARAVAVEQKLRWMEELCDGLGYAHAAGIIHRDIKPANLMIDGSGSLKILDFGVARAVQSAGLTQTGMLVGTLSYMSPEQLAAGTVDHRSDVHAVGAVFYELLSYRQAFPGTLADVLADILHGQPEPLSAAVPGLDAEIVAIVERCLQKNPGDRYQDLAVMVRELRRVRGRIAGADATGQAVQPAHSPVAGPPLSASEIVPAAPSRTADPTPARAGSPRRGADVEAIAAAAEGGGQVPTQPAPGAGPRRSGSRRLWLWAVAALIALAPVGFVLFQANAEPTPGMEDPAAQSADPAADTPPFSPTGPEEGGEENASTAADTSTSIEPDSSVEPAQPRDSSNQPPAVTPLPPRCVRLLERVSLGETLTQEDEDFLTRQCRRGGGTL